jgi:ribose 5-phosphate isomerase A
MSDPELGPGSSNDPGVRAAAAHAMTFIREGARIGLGTGRAASAFVDQLGSRVRNGFPVSAVPTSQATADRARQAGIPLIEPGDGGFLDLTVDGADEVAPNLDLVKGLGGALVRERIVAAASARLLILVGEEKLVRGLGELGPIPVEVIPLGAWLAERELQALQLVPTRRLDPGGSRPFITENGNFTYDCAVPAPLRDAVAARDLERAIRAIVGVVDTGLVLGKADAVIVGRSDGSVDTLTRAGSRQWHQGQ